MKIIKQKEHDESNCPICLERKDIMKKGSEIMNKAFLEDAAVPCPICDDTGIGEYHKGGGNVGKYYCECEKGRKLLEHDEALRER